MTKKTVEIDITGIVQGVGFRPFLFNLARELELRGYVLNRGNAGVRLVLHGDANTIEKFLEDVKKKRPKISYIEDLIVKEHENLQTFNKLEIRKSEPGRGISLTLPPDIAVCENCLREMRNPDLQNYYMYPFIACAVCGPRYTTVTALPYDRERSTMQEFPFCKSCLNEYSDFDNRRFHAQTFACATCGPNYTLYDNFYKEIKKPNISEILNETAKRIHEGEVAAIKGIGGVHLVCLANNENVILKLRNRKGRRKYKPFALMISNLEIIRPFFNISKAEEQMLTSFRRPIVLIEKRENFEYSNISDLVAPGLHNIGFMLPYTGIHHLLFDFIGNVPLVYTSGNKSNIPMGIDNNKIFNQLHHLADFFLLHNRTIHQRADDSVLRMHKDKIKLIRRSRGFIPEYLPLPFAVRIPGAIATGPELSATGAVLRRNRIFPTQHIGNITHLETFEFLKDAIFHMKNLLQIKDSEVKFIACDAHPAFITTQFAKDLGKKYEIPVYPIQHHFAHLLGLMAENKVERNERIIGISTDGVGYGDDGNIWGGEILLSSYRDYKRFSHLQYQPMIGGDRCTKYPARMAASIILNSCDIDEAKRIFKKLSLYKDLEHKEKELNVILSQFKNANKKFPSENIPLSSSTGRIFDTVSYLLGACNLTTYRGEPAMRLEALAAKGDPSKIDMVIKSYQKDGNYTINTSQLILDIINLLENTKHRKPDIAASFQIQIAKSFANLAIKKANQYEIDKIGLTGGVAYNSIFSTTIKKVVRKNGLSFLEHHLVAPGDAGISIGQLIGGFFKYSQE
ncbi:MAG: carbamoyltransferase HypF [Candidatus Lokiarchaeota archaeon]|nr:carbamoyltransferase HypF [Candidatus Lokiarchaeota archaeon]MBD3338957.1 carbamoyltransferase HypF [Candidatus Lokiarchaeota archaeon]